jgi:hypothetical protein
MSSLKWGCCLLVLLFLCACSTTAQISSDPQGKVGTADASDKQAAKKNVKNGKSNGSSATLARNVDGKTPEKAQGLGPGFSGMDPSGKAPEDFPPGAQPGVLTTGQTVKSTGSNGQDNGDSAIEEDVDEIVDLLRLAQAYRDKGDMDNALKSLDKAYGILLAEEDDNSVIVRQKDDLRLIIARKILEIYAGRRTATIGKASEIPLTLNADVEKEIRSFQTIERNFFERSYERSGYYLPFMKQQLRQAGLPEELAWLPLVESGFQVHALSKARALGPWQFIPSTGYKYGLNRDLFIDERMSVEKSTQAAIAYLTDLHGLFGDWLTALAAYNCGEGRVLKVISRQQINYLDHFWDLYRQLPNETARYVPRFLATLHIVKNPKKYGALRHRQPDRHFDGHTRHAQPRASAPDDPGQALRAQNPPGDGSTIRTRRRPDQGVEATGTAGARAQDQGCQIQSEARRHARIDFEEIRHFVEVPSLRQRPEERSPVDGRKDPQDPRKATGEGNPGGIGQKGQIKENSRRRADRDQVHGQEGGDADPDRKALQYDHGRNHEIESSPGGTAQERAGPEDQEPERGNRGLMQEG